MFPGGFRAKLNSRFCRRASVFATTVVALPSSPLPITRLCIFHQICQLFEERRMDLSCLCFVRQAVLSAFLQLDGTLQHALSELAGVWDQFKMRTAFASLAWNIEGKARLYRCSRKVSVTHLFSPDKLIDYSPAL